MNGKIAPAQYSAHFSVSFLVAVTPAQVSAEAGQLSVGGPWSITRYLSGPTATGAEVALVSATKSEAQMTIQIDGASHLITELVVHPAPPGGVTASPSPALAAMAAALAAELAGGQFGTVRASFDPTMSASLSEQQLAASWSQVAGSLGVFKTAATPISKNVVAGFATYFVPLTFDKGGLQVQVSFDGQGQIAGLFLRPPGYDSNF